MIFRQVSTDPDHDEQAEDALFYRDALQELVQIGTDLARLLHQNAVAQAQAAVRDLTPCAPPTDHATAFDRIARAVRRTIALARSLYEPVARALVRTRAAFGKATPPGAGQDAAGHPAAAPGHDDSAKDADVPSADLRDRPEALDRDRPERPDRDAPDRDDDRDEDDTARPPAEIIADIRRDLGLDAPPSADTRAQRTPAEIEQPCAGPHGPGPQPPGHGPAQPDPGPGPDGRDPDGPAASVLRHPAQAQAEARWRPPPTA